MSIRTIIEINHDHLTLHTAADLLGLMSILGQSTVTGLLNHNDGQPVTHCVGIRVLAQRHHSEILKLEVK